MTRSLRKVSGFTLVEMAVVLVIIGLIAGGTMSYMRAQMDSARLSATKTRQQAVQLAIQSFVQRNGRLPCPAPAATVNGIEAPTVGVCTGAVTIGVGALATSRGVVPWATLGLSQDMANDGYGRRITYQVTLNTTSTTRQTLNAIVGRISIFSNAPVLACTVPPAAAVAGCNQLNTANLAVYTLISYGSNGLGAYLAGGTTMPAAVGALEIENTDANNNFVSTQFSDAAPVYDDIIIWASVADILAPLTNDGSIKSAQSAQFEMFNQITQSLVQSAVINVAGVAPNRIYTIPAPTGAAQLGYTLPAGTFPASCGAITTLRLPAALPGVTYTGGNVLDTWGTQLVYASAASVSSVNTGYAPGACTTATVLVSAGPDGAFGTADDILFPTNPMSYLAAFSARGF